MRILHTVATVRCLPTPETIAASMPTQVLTLPTIELTQPSSTLSSSQRVPELDGLRGIAILSVMGFHYLYAITSEGTGLFSYLHPLVAMGWTGVDLFFVLSGFLIGGILLDARNSQCYFRTFYLRRFYRIIPLYYVWIAGGIFLLSVIGNSRHFVIEPTPGTALPAYVYLLFLQNLSVFPMSGVASAWFGPTWSLAVEEQFYLIAPVLIWLLPKRTLVVALVLVVLLAPAMRFAVHNCGESGPALANLLMPCRADSLAMGVLAAIVWRDPRARTFLEGHTSIANALFAAAVGGIAVASFAWYSQPWSLGMQTIGLSLISLFFVITLLFVLMRPTSKIASITRMGWIRSVGSVSYCMYLIHVVIWAACCNSLLHVKFRNSISWPALAASLLAGVLTFALAKISWAWFEQPLLVRGHSHRY